MISRSIQAEHILTPPSGANNLNVGKVRPGLLREIPAGQRLPESKLRAIGVTSERNAQNMSFKPSDLPAAHIFKIGPEGQVHEIEAIGFLAPLNAPSGWEGTAYAASFAQPRKP